MLEFLSQKLNLVPRVISRLIQLFNAKLSKRHQQLTPLKISVKRIELTEIRPGTTAYAWTPVNQKDHTPEKPIKKKYPPSSCDGAINHTYTADL